MELYRYHNQFSCMGIIWTLRAPFWRSCNFLRRNGCICKLKKYLLVLTVLLLGGVVFYNLNPVQYWFMPKCMFKLLTGYSCPGCGIQRALYALLHGDVIKAIQYNYLCPAVKASQPHAEGHSSQLGGYFQQNEAFYQAKQRRSLKIFTISFGIQP